MGCMYHVGHFAVIDSLLKPARWNRHGIRRVAIVELSGTVVPQKFDPRLKAIKQIIWWWEGPSYGNGSSAAYKTNYKKAMRWVDEFNKMWPLHFMHREWPLPYYLPPHKVQLYGSGD